jgi:hypothetical protein
MHIHTTEHELRSAESERDELALIIAQQEHNNIDAHKITTERQRIMVCACAMHDLETRPASLSRAFVRWIRQYHAMTRER